MPKAPSPPAPPEAGSALRIGAAPNKPGLPAPADGTDAPLPHERDQAVGQVAKEPDPVIVQAKRDIDAGMVDTDMRATPGLDAERRSRLVPEPGPSPTSGTRRPARSPSPTARRRAG